MRMDGKVSDTAAPPFATKGGSPTAKDGGSGGGFDPWKNPNGSQPATGGRDFNSEHRAQSEAKPEQNIPQEEVPKGGIAMQADAGAVSGSGKLGGVEPLGREAKPFRVK